MNDTSQSPQRALNGWRIAGWSALAALLALPVIAMQFTSQVAWNTADFVIAGGMLVALGLGIELAVRIARSGIYRSAIIAAVVAGFVTFWVNGAVGIIGNEGQPINLAFYAMLLAGILASALVSLRPAPMAAITAIMTIGQLAVGLVAEFTFQPEWGPVLFMTVLWAVPAILFRKASGMEGTIRRDQEGDPRA